VRQKFIPGRAAPLWIVGDTGNSRPERMGGNARPLHAFPWIWTDNVRVDGGARIRLVCAHCDKGAVLAPDTKWGPPSPGQDVPSLRSNVAQFFIRQHQVCEDAAKRDAIVWEGRERVRRIR
jgi:hypothetical protein